MAYRSIVPRHGLGASIATIVPQCTMATFFHDCFAGATGVIALPGFAGPVHGWTYTSLKNGQITFTPGLMTLQNLGINNAPGASKALLTPIPGVSNKSMQVTFTEFPDPPVSREYFFFITNNTGSQMANIYLADSGFAAVYLGNTVGLDGWSGTWTPGGGATHKVDLAITGANVPIFYIDDVSISLNFDGTGFSPIFTPPANTASVQFSGGGPATVMSGTVTKFFVTNGVQLNTVIYCC